MTHASGRYSIRRGNSADADVLAAFNAAMALETEERKLDGPTLLRGVQMLLADEQRGAYFVAEECATKRLAGQLLITREWSDWRAGEFWWIQSVYVRPEDRRQGVFRQLMQHVEQAARQDNLCTGLRLYVDGSNQSAKQVYQTLGWCKTHYQVMEIDWSGCSHAIDG